MQGGQHRAGPSGLVFDIQRCLGRGGFGEVYLATMVTPTGVRSEVALKALRSDLDPGSDAIKRLRDEGRMLGALRHPSILSVHDLVLLDDRVALVTEYVDGLDLAQLIREDEGIPLRPLLAVIGEVASALSAAWKAPSPEGQPMRLVHRDIKPANIRLSRHGEVKLLDFGVARASAMQREAHTQTNMALGSLGYMAPERFLEDDAQPPSDVYSLGCALFEGLTRRRVFPKADFRSVMLTMARPERFAEHLREAFDALPPTVPPAVRDLVKRLLRPEAAQRPSADEVALLCEDLADVMPGPTLRRWCTDRSWPDATSVRGASLRPGRFTAATYDQWEVRITQGEPPRRPAPPNIIRDRPPPVRDPAASGHTPQMLTRAPAPTLDTPVPPSEAKTLPPQDLGLRPLDPMARFGIDDLSDAEFDRALRARNRWVWWRRAAVVAVVLAVGSVAGLTWAYPTEAKALLDRALTELRALASAPDAEPVEQGL